MSGLTLSATYKWVITDWSKKRGQEELLSETFSVGGHNWCVAETRAFLPSPFQLNLSRLFPSP
jgi:hypothetical protein